MSSSSSSHQPLESHLTPSSPPCVQARGVVKTFRTRSGTVTAVDNVDLDIQQGEIVALLGSNGAGKSTFLDLVLGLQRPTAGSVQVFGRSPREAIERELVGAVLQTGGLLPDMTVRNTVRMIASTFSNPLPLEKVLTAARLHEIADRKVAKCSGGEQQRLRFAMAMLGNPQLLVLDEPTAGMDTGARYDFWDNMHAQAQAGRTIIFATHYLEEVEQFAQRIVMMSKGSIVADGSVSKITAQSPTGDLSDVFLHYTRGKQLNPQDSTHQAQQTPQTRRAVGSSGKREAPQSHVNPPKEGAQSL